MRPIGTVQELERRRRRAVELVKQGESPAEMAHFLGYGGFAAKLTTEQEKLVFDTLKEARDKAVYAGSAEEKTAIFGRYKGRVNNYLSTEGYDLKLAAKEWAERRKAAGK